LLISISIQIYLGNTSETCTLRFLFYFAFGTIFNHKAVLLKSFVDLLFVSTLNIGMPYLFSIFVEGVYI